MSVGTVAVVRNLVVVYDRRLSALLSLDDFDTRAEALARRGALDVAHQADDDIEIVVLSAVDEKALRVSHARYFETIAQLSTN